MSPTKGEDAEDAAIEMRLLNLLHDPQAGKEQECLLTRPGVPGGLGLPWSSASLAPGATQAPAGTG